MKNFYFLGGSHFFWWFSFHFQGQHFITLERATIDNLIAQRTHRETFWVLHRELLLMNVSKTEWEIVLVLLWFRIFGNTVKTLSFCNNTHSSIKSRCIIQRRIQNPIKHLRRSVLPKKLLVIRYLRGFWIHLCYDINSVFAYWTKWKWNTYQ